MEKTNLFSMENEIKFKSFIIYWKPWEWKTLLANVLISDYVRIYSNVDFFKKWKKINISISSIEELQKIRYDPTPWIVLIDESGINVSSRLSMSKNNRDFSEFLFLWRKINCRIIWISQRFKSLDLNTRELADCILHIYKISRYNKHPIFICAREKIRGGQLVFDTERSLDIIEWMKKEKRTYNTLQRSIII